MQIQTDLYSFSYKKGSLVTFCKRCGEQNFYRDGRNKKGIQRYRCKKCNFRFVWTSDLARRRYFSNIISFAVELYTDLRKGISLEGIAELLKKVFNVEVSYEAIRLWVLTCNKKICHREIPQATCWHADETYFKIKGKGHWLWIVRCRQTGQVLSWRISKGRFFKDAKKLMHDALHVAGARPKKIITDGLYQYAAAIYKAMGWNWREHKEKHIVDSGIGKNAVLERVNREIKRRVRWFSTFQSVEGAKAFFGLWFYHYNQRKSTHVT